MQKRKILDWWQAMTPGAPFGAHALRSCWCSMLGHYLQFFDYFHSLVILVASLLAFFAELPVSWMERQVLGESKSLFLFFWQLYRFWRWV